MEIVKRCCSQASAVHSVQEVTNCSPIYICACKQTNGHTVASYLLFSAEPTIINWSPWSEWGDCTEECGNGTRFRTRFCNDTFKESMDVTINCVGRTLDEESCNTHPCPSKHCYFTRSCGYSYACYVLVNGNWSEWSPFGTCSDSCGGGIQFRFRTCDNPPPQYGGSECDGEVGDSRPCNTHHCPSKECDKVVK